jgi:hypothetical protein
VEAVTITNGYVTLDDLTDYSGTDYSTADSQREQAIEAASRWVDGYCGRHFFSVTATARTFVPCDYYELHLGCDLVSVTTLKTDDDADGTFETTISSTNYELLTVKGGHNPALVGETWPYDTVRLLNNVTFPVPTSTERSNRVQITGTWGWSSVPVPVKQATLLLASRLVTRKDAPFGVVAAGDLAFRTGRMDDDVVNMLAPYRKFGFA